MHARAIVTEEGHLRLLEPMPRGLAVGSVVTLELIEGGASNEPGRNALDLAGCLREYGRAATTGGSYDDAILSEAARLFERSVR